MIVYDVQCAKGHVFTEWFNSSSDYAAKAKNGKIACSECGDTSVQKALVAPNVATKGAAEPAPAACGAPACGPGMCAMAKR